MSDIDMDLEKKQGDDIAEDFKKDEPVKPLWAHDDKDSLDSDKKAEGFFGSMDKDDDDDLEKPSFLRRLKRRKEPKNDEKTDKGA
jgi:hypothetical protein